MLERIKQIKQTQSLNLLIHKSQFENKNERSFTATLGGPSDLSGKGPSLTHGLVSRPRTGLTASFIQLYNYTHIILTSYLST